MAGGGAKMHTFVSRREWRRECRARGYEVEPMPGCKDRDNARAYNADRTKSRVMGQWTRKEELGGALWGNSPVTRAKNTGWLYLLKNPVRF